MDNLSRLIEEYVMPHWPFVFMSFSLGMIGQVLKKHVWTFERAVRKQGAYKLMYTTMGLHAPLMGALLGLLGAPVSPGISGWAGRMLYHFGAGASAAWVVAAVKHFMKSRGIIVAESIAPPSLSTMPGAPTAPGLEPFRHRPAGERVSLTPDTPVQAISIKDDDEPGP